MKCPNCGEEIAKDSVFCEFCGTNLSVRESNSSDNNSKTDDSKVVKSSYVAWLMFLFVCFSVAEICCMDGLVGHGDCYLLERTYHPTFLCVSFVNLCLLVCCVAFAIKKIFRKSTAIVLGVMSAIISVCSFFEYLWSWSSDDWFYSPYFGEAGATLLIYVLGIYAIYWIIAKWKNIKF